MSTINLVDAWKVLETSVSSLVGDRARPSYNIGVLQLLTSSAWNNAGIMKLGEVDPGRNQDGKVYKVARTIYPRTSVETTANTLEYCPDNGDEVIPKYDEIEITEYHVSRKIKIDDELMRCIKDGKATYTDFAMNNALIDYLTQLGQKVATKLGRGGYAGNFIKCECDDAGETHRELPLFMANGFNLNPVAQSILMRDYQEAELSQPFVLIGSSPLQNYRTAAALQSGNELGFDASLLDIGNAPYFDPNLSQAMGGPNKIMALAPGAIKLNTYSKHQGQFAYPTQFDQHMRSTVVDPFFGLTHDVTMSYKVCEDEIEYFIQFGIGWDLVGMGCWSEECKFDGVTDIFTYEAVCDDTSYCDFTPACSKVRTSEPVADGFCESAQPCDITCVADFGTDCGAYTRHGVSGLTLTAVEAFRVNGGPDISLGGVYNLTNSDDSDAIIAKLKTQLGAYAGVTLVSKRFTGGATFFEIFTDASITTIELVDNVSGANALSSVSSNFIHVYSLATPSAGASITDIAWIGGNGVTTFNGAPGETISNAAIVNYYGDNDEFFAEINQGGSYQMTITDSTACSDVQNRDSVECPVLWDIQWTAFDDVNDNDVQDGGELGLLDIKVQVYADAGLTTLVAEDVSDASGLVDFALSTGQYYMTVDTTYGAAAGRGIITTLPKGFYVDLNGSVMYSNAWTEEELIPIGPAV